ncbi:MAG: LTA synthase family protein [Candidatus Polarisedimenticolaceae bacterium]|nr:LTA synthase family protein [Candidatus Polarisedimenticolaceae bacterium]
MQIENKQLGVSVFMLSLYITIVSPLNILIGNYEEFNYGVMEVLFAAIPYFIVAFSVLIVPLLFLKGVVKRGYLTVMVFLLIITVINSEILFGDYGAFDGRGLNIEEYSLTSFAQLLVAIAVACAVLLSKLREKLIIFSSVFLFLSFVLNLSLFVFADGVFFKEPKAPSQDFVNLSKDKPNYLYIILDEIYGGSTQEVFRTQNDLVDKFTGFTNYANTAGVYPTTIMSIPAILTSQLYQEGTDVDEFYRKSFKESPLLKTFRANNFDFKIHTVGRYCSELPNDTCSPTGTLGSGFTSVLSDYFRTLNLSLLKSVPDVLKKQVYNGGNWLVHEVNGNDGYIKEFDYFVDNLKVSSGPSTFRLFHTTLTHSPVRYNHRCELLEDNLPPNYGNYLGQDTCGFVQVGRIIDKLKGLGVYDNTYLIVSSDHGRPSIPSELENKFLLNKNVSSKEYGYAHATLMIKPLNAGEEFKSSHQPASLIDIAPLIISDINDNSYDLSHERKYYHYNWSLEYHNWGKKTLPPFKGVYSIGDDIKDPFSWVLDVRYMQNLLSQRLKTTLKCGDNVFFGSAKKVSNSDDLDDKDIYYGSGLSDVESWGRWSDKKNVRFFFKLDNSACKQRKILMRIRGFVTQAHPVQRGNVVLNEVKIGEVVINFGEKNPQDFMFDIPFQIVKPGKINVLEFHIDNPVSPKSVGFNNDQRLLGLGFESMVFQ